MIGNPLWRASQFIWGISLRASLWAGIWAYSALIYRFDKVPHTLALLLFPFFSFFLGFCLLGAPCAGVVFLLRPQTRKRLLLILTVTAFLSMVIVNVLGLTHPHIGIPFLSEEQYQELEFSSD